MRHENNPHQHFNLYETTNPSALLYERRVTSSSNTGLEYMLFLCSFLTKFLQMLSIRICLILLPLLLPGFSWKIFSLDETSLRLALLRRLWKLSIEEF